MPYADAQAARHGLRQDPGTPPPPPAGSYSSLTGSGGDGHKVSQEGVDVAASPRDERATTDDPNTDTKTLALASAAEGAEREAEAGVAAGRVGRSDGDVIFVGREPELLYGVNFTVAPPHEGDEPTQLSAEVYVTAVAVPKRNL